MYVMAKKVTLCISIHKENSLWHGLGIVQPKFPSCRESKLCHPKSKKWSFPVYPSRLSRQWMGKERFLQEAAVATGKVRTLVRCDGTLWLSFMCLPSGEPEHQVDVHSWFSYGVKSWHRAWPVPSSCTQKSFPGLYSNNLDPDQASPPNHLPATVHQSKRNKVLNR